MRRATFSWNHLCVALAAHLRVSVLGMSGLITGNKPCFCFCFNSDSEDEEEAKGGVSKSKNLVHCSREVRMGTNQALNHGKEVYTSAAMKAVQDITRPRRVLDPATGKTSYPKKTRQ